LYFGGAEVADFLWRIHKETPRRGMVGVFNRSHYEDVLIVRVKNLVPKAVRSKRYALINAFEEGLLAGGTKIIKIYLHIDKDEQKKRLEQRLNDPEKNWKFNPADLPERENWKAYMKAFEEVFKQCSSVAPWYVIPANSTFILTVTNQHVFEIKSKLVRWFPHLCGFLATAFLAVFFVYPLVVILQRGFSTEAFTSILQNPYYSGRILFTLYQALLSTLLTLLLGLPSALLFARYTFPGKRLLRAAFTIPFVMPTIVVAIGFLTLVGPRGILNINLRDTFGLLLLAHVFYNYAVVVRIVGAYLEGQGVRLREAAAVLTLPLAAPALVAAATLVFIFCFTSFGVILLLTPSPEFATLEVEIYRLTARLLDLEGSSVLVVVQLLIIGVLTFVYTRLQARLSVPLKNKRPLEKPRGFSRTLVGINFLIAFVLILSPLVAISISAFISNGQLSLTNFQTLSEAPRTIGFAGAGRAIRNSLRFAVSSTTLSLLVGFAFAYAVVRGNWRWLDGLSLLPLATSAVTLGLGYLLAFPLLRTSPWGLTLAHTLIAFPFVTRSLLPALRSLPSNLLGAATTLGASPFKVLFRVELPLLTPSLITAASFAFAISLGEFGATLVIQSERFATLPVAIFDRLGRPGAASYGSALALSFILMSVTATVMMVLERFEEKG
jgi:thiamine transport system permease protein